MAKTVSDPILTSITHLLHRACQCADDKFAEAMGGTHLTARQLVVLKIVDDLDRPSQVDICDRSGIDRSTLADIVRRLIQKGFIARRRTREDARRYALRLTDEGQRALDHAVPLARDADSKLILALTPPQRQQFSGALQAILRSSGPAPKS